MYFSGTMNYYKALLRYHKVLQRYNSSITKYYKVLLWYYKVLFQYYKSTTPVLQNASCWRSDTTKNRNLETWSSITIQRTSHFAREAIFFLANYLPAKLQRPIPARSIQYTMSESGKTKWPERRFLQRPIPLKGQWRGCWLSSWRTTMGI